MDPPSPSKGRAEEIQEASSTCPEETKGAKTLREINELTQENCLTVNGTRMNFVYNADFVLTQLDNLLRGAELNNRREPDHPSYVSDEELDEIWERYTEQRVEWMKFFVQAIENLTDADGGLAVRTHYQVEMKSVRDRLQRYYADPAQLDELVISPADMRIRVRRNRVSTADRLNPIYMALPGETETERILRLMDECPQQYGQPTSDTLMEQIYSADHVLHRLDSYMQTASLNHRLDADQEHYIDDHELNQIWIRYTNLTIQWIERLVQLIPQLTDNDANEYQRAVYEDKYEMHSVRLAQYYADRTQAQALVIAPPGLGSSPRKSRTDRRRDRRASPSREDNDQEESEASSLSDPGPSNEGLHSRKRGHDDAAQSSTGSQRHVVLSRAPSNEASTADEDGSTGDSSTSHYPSSQSLDSFSSQSIPTISDTSGIGSSASPFTESQGSTTASSFVFYRPEPASRPNVTPQYHAEEQVGGVVCGPAVTQSPPGDVAFGPATAESPLVTAVPGPSGEDGKAKSPIPRKQRRLSRDDTLEDVEFPSNPPTPSPTWKQKTAKSFDLSRAAFSPVKKRQPTESTVDPSEEARTVKQTFDENVASPVATTSPVRRLQLCDPPRKIPTIRIQTSAEYTTELSVIEGVNTERIDAPTVTPPPKTAVYTEISDSVESTEPSASASLANQLTPSPLSVDPGPTAAPDPSKSAESDFIESTKPPTSARSADQSSVSSSLIDPVSIATPNPVKSAEPPKPATSSSDQSLFCSSPMNPVVKSDSIETTESSTSASSSGPTSAILSPVDEVPVVKPDALESSAPPTPISAGLSYEISNLRTCEPAETTLKQAESASSSADTGSEEQTDQSSKMDP